MNDQRRQLLKRGAMRAGHAGKTVLAKGREYKGVRRRAIAALATWMLVAAHAPAGAQNVWLNGADIAALRGQPVKTKSLMRRCDMEIDKAASPVPVFAPPPHYTRDGVTVTDVSANFAGDGGLAYRAALCFAASGDTRYAAHAQHVISAWADQLIAVSSEQGAAEINFDLPQYVLAASLVQGVHGWNDQSFRRLLTGIALPLSHIGKKNNHANWGVFLNAAIGAYLGDRALVSAARERWLTLMDTQIAADGSLPLEICRSDTIDHCGGDHKGINGLSYTHYTLLPTTAAARIFDMQGQSVWHTRQASKLDAAYRKAASWTRHPEMFPYFNANHAQLNGVRNAAYFALLQHVFPNDEGEQVLASGKLGMNALEWTLLFD
ncbi:MAG: hypothetical protein EOO78_04395 [Oxalobacteraceae bacterium]|nr:MAG: hypothetical protein EOO78_04395 [Oxalobacteraceae bacterium]